MEWSASESTLREAERRFGEKPHALQIKPPLTSAVDYYFELFRLLFSGASVSLLDIALLCNLRGDTDVEKAIFIVKELEKLYISKQNKPKNG